MGGRPDASGDAGMKVTGELLPCPTCWLPADVVEPPPYDVFPHARCPRGHDNVLIPAVLAHLRSLDSTLPESA